MGQTHFGGKAGTHHGAEGSKLGRMVNLSGVRDLEGLRNLGAIVGWGWVERGRGHSWRLERERGRGVTAGMGWRLPTPRGGPSPSTPDVSSSSDVGAALSTSGRRPGSPYCPCVYSLHPGLEGPRASLWGSVICSLWGFISLMSRPTPHSCRPCVP